MSKDRGSKPDDVGSERARRLAERLRRNLHRRKAQARARAGDADADAGIGRTNDGNAPSSGGED